MRETFSITKSNTANVARRRKNGEDAGVKEPRQRAVVRPRPVSAFSLASEARHGPRFNLQERRRAGIFLAPGSDGRFLGETHGLNSLSLSFSEVELRVGNVERFWNLNLRR